MAEIDLTKLHAEFPKDKIHWRAQTVTKAGDKAMALAYLDSRDVQERLDQVCGPANWQAEHYDCGGGKLGCRIGIRINGEWVWKGDGAGDTAVEAEKGAFSSALKRAAVLWGIGRYLYDLPAPWVPCETYNGKFKKFTDNPWNYCNRNVRGERDSSGKYTKTAMYQKMREFSQELDACKDPDQLHALVFAKETKELLNAAMELDRQWYDAAKAKIDNLTATLNEEARRKSEYDPAQKEHA